MSDFDSPLDQRILDRMVDGELTDEEQQAVLQQLESTNDCAGWRRLALAFVEDQVLRRTLGGDLVAEAEPVSAFEQPGASTRPEIRPFSPSGARVSEGREWWPAGLLHCRPALVALCIVPLVLLSFWYGRFRGDREREDAYSTVFQSLDLPPDEVIDTGPRQGEPLEDRSLASGNPVSDTPLNDALDSATTVRFVYGSDWSGTPQIVDIPVVSDAEADLNSFLDTTRPGFSADVLQALEEAGHRVEESRDLWSVSLPDGKAAVIPVHQVRFSPANNVFP